MSPHITVRSALEPDACFAYEVRESSMRQYVVETWGEWDEDEVRRQIAEDIRLTRLSVVELDRKPVGILRVDDQPEHVDIDQMFLQREHQRKGLGTVLLQRILARARQRRVPVRLWVLRVNPARTLYERVGFSVFEETAASLHLQSAA